MVRKFRRRPDLGIHDVRLLINVVGLSHGVQQMCIGSGKEVLKYFETLKEVLEKPFPRGEEIERCVPPDAELKPLFMEMLDEIG